MKRVLAIASVMLAACLSGAWTARTTIPAALVATQSVPDAWVAAGLNTGLVSYWAMRTNTATTVFDEYGTNTGTAVNSPTFGTAYGKRDDGARFTTAGNNYITVPNSSSLQPGTNAFTVATWMRYNTTNETAYLAKRDPDNLTPGYVFYSGGGKLRVLIKDGGGVDNRVAEALSAWSTNQWYHVAMVKSGLTATLYVNGVYQGVSGALTGDGSLNTTVAMNIGRQYIASSSANADIDEVAIWSRALSSNEVYQLHSTPLYAPYKQ